MRVTTRKEEEKISGTDVAKDDQKVSTLMLTPTLIQIYLTNPVERAVTQQITANMLLTIAAPFIRDSARSFAVVSEDASGALQVMVSLARILKRTRWARTENL